MLRERIVAKVAAAAAAALMLGAHGGANAQAAVVPAGAAACASCHGARGEGVGDFPRLAGTGGAYLRAQLDAFAAGQRKSAVMQPIARALAPEQRAQVAAYYASLPAPVRPEDQAPKGPGDVGAWLATRGRWSQEIPACAQCHGPGGSGVGASFPPLAGQPAAYLVQQLQAWHGDGRPPGPLGLMQQIARKLSDADIQAVSAYYAGLGAAAPAGTSNPPAPKAAR